MTLFKKIALLSLALAACGNLAQAKSTDSAEFERKVNLLGKLVYGVTKHTIRGEDTEDMIVKLAMKNTGDDRAEVMNGFQRNLPANKISFSDMVGWGTMKLDSALNLFESQEAPRNESGEDKDISKSLVLGKQLIKELNKMGAGFGFTDGSSGYCGVSFMGLLITNEEDDAVYEIALSPSGSC